MKCSICNGSKIIDTGYYHYYPDVRSGEMVFVKDGNTKECPGCAQRSINSRDLISGHDLISIGIEPGPRMGQVFKLLDEQLLKSPLMTKEDTLAFARQLKE